jgi:hypothetical protein
MIVLQDSVEEEHVPMVQMELYVEMEVIAPLAIVPHQEAVPTLQFWILVMELHALTMESAKEMAFANAKTLLSRSKMEKIVLAQMEHFFMRPQIVAMHQLLPQLYLLCLHL